jgi:LysR family nitrogen assimilation transcriptional regulator
MNSRTWRNFLTVAALGSITRACSVLHLTQPALTRQMAALEEEVGKRLFARHRRGLSLTEAGQLMVERATDILAQVDALEAEIRSEAREPAGELVVGMPPSFALFIGPTVLNEFARSFPKVMVTFREAATEELVAAVRNGEMDAAVATVGAPTRSLHARVFARDYMGLIGQRDPAKKSRSRGVTVKALRGKPLVLMSRTKFLQDRIDYAAAREDISLSIVMRANSMVMLDLVAQGMGYTIMPMCAALSPKWDHNLDARPILDLPIEWALCTRLNRPHSAALNAFAQTIFSLARSSGLDWVESA